MSKTELNIRGVDDEVDLTSVSFSHLVLVSKVVEGGNIVTMCKATVARETKL